MVQGLVDLVHRQAATPLEINEDAGVDRTGAGPHHQSFQGRESHGGGHGQAAADGRRRTPAAEMAADQAKLGRVAGEHLRRPTGAIRVADAVEAEAAAGTLLEEDRTLYFAGDHEFAFNGEQAALVGEDYIKIMRKLPDFQKKSQILILN